MSLKLILADDEQIEREVLKMIISRALPEVTIVAEAKNGRQAVELGREHRPDIMMMDIKMPGMDGLTAIRELREELPMTKFILVSAYDYFDYAQEAVSLGVKEYVLKPASNQKVVETIQRIIQEIEQERSRHEEEQQLRERLAQMLPLVENELTTLLMLDNQLDSYHTYADVLQLSEVKGFAIVAAFHPVEEWMKEADPALFHLEKQACYDKLREKAKEWADCLVSPMLWQQTTLFVLTDEGRQAEYSARVEAIKLARRLANLFAQGPVRVRFGIGNRYDGFDGLQKSYQEAVMAVKDPSVPAVVHHYADLPLTVKSYDYSFEQERVLLEKIRLGRTEESLLLFHRMLEAASQASQGEIRYVRRFLIECLTVISRVALDYQLSLTQFSQYSFDTITTVAEARQTGEYWIRQISGQINEERSRKMGNVLEQVKDYLQRNYSKDIKLEEVAEQFHLSPYYLSKMFSQQCGITFIDYLTQLRIEQAKRYLAHSEKGLKEIAIEVGYANPNYFSRVFKKVTGQAPSEYRRD
ncbi:helix-turn-helix domain-containing protein [Brevibacillus dissolubilis]|uniref:helix-turn-helix domain-containing protein n=1 Tax=Brevibacillus dissolubilis TaxID=1844116 RepID=UPI001116AF40|nr:helix-turn-helix domain-containing protein [Brevibacillus dissolubilis]